MRSKFLLLVIFFNVIGFVSQAQTATKIGYANVEYIISKLPEVNKVETELETANTTLKNQLDALVSEYQQKLQEYEQSVGTMLDAVKVVKETELGQMQQRIRDFRANAQTSLQQKQAELMNPLFVKVRSTINELAKEEGFKLILNSQMGGMEIVLFADDKIDVSDKVLKRLGIEVII